jgi:hypothetical protein
MNERIHFGWYGTRAADKELPTPGPVTRDQVVGWYGTALNTYIPYGMAAAASWDTYVRVAGESICLVRPGEPVRLLLELPMILWADLRAGDTQRAMGWLADANERWGMVHAEDREPRVLGFYADEPNHPSKNIPADTLARARAALTKPLTAVVCPGGSRDPFHPMVTPLLRSDQGTHDALARCVSQVGGYCYPLATGAPEWARIERLQTQDGYDGSLLYCQRNGAPFLYAIQTQEEPGGKRMPLVRTLTHPRVWADGRAWSDELCWMVHRAMLAGAGTIMFYSWNRADAQRHEAVWNLCRLIDAEGANCILAGRALASSDRPEPAWCQLPDGASIHYTYHYWRGDFYLLVVDAHPESATERPALTCTCRTLAPPTVVTDRYGLELSGGPDTPVPAAWSEDTGCVAVEVAPLRQGEVRLYRLAQPA